MCLKIIHTKPMYPFPLSFIFPGEAGGKKSSLQVTLRLKLVWVKVGMSLYLYSRCKCISVCFKNEFTSQGT